MTRVTHAVLVAALLTVPVLVERADAHHGAGRYDTRKKVEFAGRLTRLDFVNPHSYVYFDVVGDDGKVIAMKCEMRSATTLRRSGWSPEMFVRGAAIKVTGSAHRDDPTACSVDTLTLGDKPTLERYQQLSDAKSVDRTKRPFRLPNGKPNLAGEWAQEQHVLASPPGGRVGLVPISQATAIRAGKLPMPNGPRGWFPPPVTLTAAGRTAQEALGKRSTSEDPRLSCQVTSILFDWVFDGAIGRITQSATVIKMEYGVGLTRTVHLNMTAHPANIKPSRAGHSIGRWDADTLVVDSVGFEPGTLTGSLPHSNKLHVVERFTLNPATFELTRGIVAEDPVYFADKYVDSDSVLPADAPFRVEACKELAPEYQPTGRK
ncbi:MAG TPA: DUF6152 family protein [Vicinamibacterales bacterium]|nr:DUF6152 family protein [Vicinamibacterales bacterium]